MKWYIPEVRRNGSDREGLSEAGCCLHRLQALVGQEVQEGHALLAQHRPWLQVPQGAQM